MRLNLFQPSVQAHNQIAAGVGWNAFSELFSCSDDHSICRWSSTGDLEGKVCLLEGASFTDLQWFPAGSRKQQGAGAGGDIFAVACIDGTFKLVTRTGKVEKSIEAHQGAVLRLRWSLDGSALATAGEDGQVRVWSRTGMLRSTLAQADAPVHCVAWGQDGDSLAYCSGPSVAVKPLQGGGAPGPGGSGAGGSSTGLAPGGGGGGSGAPRAGPGVAWRAHDGVVLALDWSPVSGLIVTAGEDCKYKVWDPYGRQLFSSTPLDHAVTSVAWSPSGQMFAAGSFNSIALCDRMGWTYAKARADVGSILGLAWSADGTQLAGCGGGGGVVFGRLVDVRLEDRRVHALLQDERHIAVHDVLGETREMLEFRDPVVKMALGYGHLVAATATQCHIYSTSNFNTPHIFDLQQPLHLLLLCERSMLLCDAAAGMQVVTYEGRIVCSPQAAGMRHELLSSQMASLSPDTLAAMDGPGGSSVRLLDTAQGRQQGDPINHGVEIRQVALSQAGTAAERLLAIVDRNRDLTLVHATRRVSAKLASNVDAAVWHDSCPMLAAIADGKLIVWQHPAAAFADAELLEASRAARGDSNFGQGAQVTSFFGCKVLVSRAEGAQAAAWVAPQAAMLHDLARRAQWDKAVRLCRFVGDGSLWAVLAALAMAAGELPAAEAAFAAIGATDRLQFVQRCGRLPSAAVRAAEVALYRRQPAEAEALLLQAGLVYRAVKLHVRMHNWPRALELAQTQQRHVDTVLMYRRRHLVRCGQHQEPLEAYRRAAAAVAVDEDAVARRVREEKACEGGGGGGGGGAGDGLGAAARHASRQLA